MKRMSTLSMLCIGLALWQGVIGALIAPTVQAQSSETQGSWSTKAPLPMKLSEVGVAAANDNLRARRHRARSGLSACQP
jgi:hypothetical protein